MQASAFFLLACCLQVGAATYSQQTVSFSGKDVPLKTVFASVKKETGFGFFYENGEEATLKGASAVTLDLKNVSLELFLRICLKDQPLEYSVEGTTIFIKKKERNLRAQITSGPGDPIGEIKGRVINEKGEPLANANVVVKRTGRGTITNANGEFLLHNVTVSDEISVSFIGYKTQEVALENRKSLSLIMAAADNDLDKVVVKAYGVTTQRLATGNIGIVRAEDIAKQPVMNPIQAIQGLIPGAVITNTSGYASGAVKIEIRGRNTINPNIPSDPLYIIDGVPLTILDLINNGSYSSYTSGSSGFIQSGILSPANGQSPFYSLNANDIESIEVLKDADATAIYGSRGSNGVILITTKKGKIGKMTVDGSFSAGINNALRYYKMLDTKQYVQMREEALKNDGLPIDINNAPDLVQWDTSRYTNWQKYLWGGTGKILNGQVSVSGGDNLINYRVSAGYQYSTEILTENGANKKNNLSINFENKSKDQHFVMDLSAQYSYASNNMTYTSSAIQLPPNAPAVFDNKGNLNYAGWGVLSPMYPFGNFLSPYDTKTNFLTSNLTLTYHLVHGLIVKVSTGYNNFQNSQNSISPIASQDPSTNPTGYVQNGTTLGHNVIFEPQLEYNQFIGKGKLNTLLGASIQNTQNSSILLLGNGYKNDALLGSVSNAPSQTLVDRSAIYKYAAVFGRLNYNLQDKYIIDLNARRDGSSRFGPGKQFGNFGSVGAAWIFSEEDWVKKNSRLLSFGKIRASYGTTGGDQVGDYAYLTRWAFSNLTYNNTQLLTPQGHTDSLFQWQVNKKSELALDLGFFKDAITLEVAYYRDRCNNQLIQFPLPVLTGFSSVTANSPANVANSGWEYTINAKIINDNSFKWSSRFLIGFNKNKLLKYPNLSQSPYADNFEIGKPLSIQKLLHSTGVDPQTGYYTFQDINKDGQITIDYTDKTTDDRLVYDLSPKFDGSYTNTFDYNNWDLSFTFYFRKQRAVNALFTLDPPGDILNQPTAILNRWKSAGNFASTAMFTTNPDIDPSYANFKKSDGVLSDASYIRLQNISLTYTLPKTVLQKMRFSNFKFYIQGENIFILTHYQGVDPETTSFGSLPRPRTIIAGLSCNF